MRSGCMGGIAGLWLVTLTQPASAAEITIEPRLSGGVSYYNLDLDGQVQLGDNSIDDVDFEDWLLFVGGGGTVSIDRFFIDLYGQYSFTGENDVEVDIDSGGVTIDNLEQEVDFDRIETALSIGYRITDQFAAYLGYRYAVVDFDGSGSLGGAGADITAELTQSGPLIGASYIIPKTIWNGALVLNGAVTFLDGDLDIDLDAPAPIGSADFDVDGDAIGLNGGISWATPLGDRVRLVIGGDVSSYQFDDNDADSDFDELIVRLRTEVRYSF